MGWDYRVMRYANGKMGIHEVYSGDSEKPAFCTAEAVSLEGASLEELREELELMAQALALPALDFEALLEASDTASQSPRGDEN